MLSFKLMFVVPFCFIVILFIFRKVFKSLKNEKYVKIMNLVILFIIILYCGVLYLDGKRAVHRKKTGPYRFRTFQQELHHNCKKQSYVSEGMCRDKFTLSDVKSNFEEYKKMSLDEIMKVKLEE